MPGLSVRQQMDKGKCERDSVILVPPQLLDGSWTKRVSDTKYVLQESKIIKLRCFFTAVIFCSVDVIATSIKLQ